MGVAYVFETDRQVKAVERQLEAIGARLVGPYKVDSLPLRPCDESGQIRPFFLLHHSHFPQSSFTISPSTDNVLRKSARAVSDRGFDVLLSKLSAGLSPDSAGRIEVNGNEYKLKVPLPFWSEEADVSQDFHFRVGAATQAGAAVKGTLIEVEWAATCVVHQAKVALRELLEWLWTDAAPGCEQLFANRLEEVAPIDTVFQYLVLFKEMRERAS